VPDIHPAPFFCDNMHLLTTHSSQYLKKIGEVMKKLRYIAVFILILFISDVNAQYGQPLERRLGFGAEFGLIGGIEGGAFFGMAFSADYILARNFSIGEIISFIPSGDHTLFNANTVARFNIPTQVITLIPYMGIGFTYGSLDTDLGNDNAFSVSFPLGLSVSIPVAAQIEAVGRFQFAITNLDYGDLGSENNYIEFMAGFRFSPY
jgi:hypothetical protein